MIMRLVLPRYEKVHFLSGICSLFLRKEDEVHYIGGAEILPPPLEGEREAYCIRMLDGVHAERARKELIEHTCQNAKTSLSTSAFLKEKHRWKWRMRSIFPRHRSAVWKSLH
jgi:hypothetical protein